MVISHIVLKKLFSWFFVFFVLFVFFGVVGVFLVFDSKEIGKD